MIPIQRVVARVASATVAASALILITACTTVPPDAGFSDVQATLADRTPHTVRWRADSEQDALAAEAVDRLLAAPLTADAAVQIALLNNPGLEATYEQLGIAQADLVQAGLLENPVFDAALRFPIDGGLTELDLGLAFQFLELLYIPMRQAVMEAEFEAAKQRVAAAVLTHAGRTRAAYLTAVANHQLVEMLTQSVAATEAAYLAAQQLHEAGNIRSLDLHVHQALHQQTLLELADAEARALDSRESLNILMGLWDQRIGWTLDARLPDPPDESPDLADIQQRAVRDNLQLAASRHELDAHMQRLGMIRSAALLPQLELGVEAERAEGEWAVGPSFHLPIPLFDQGQARLAAADSRFRAALNRHAALAVEIRAAARSAARRVESTRRAAHFHKKQVLPLADRILADTLLQHNAMQVGVFQLLEAKRRQIDAGRAYLAAVNDYWQASNRFDVLLAGVLPDAPRLSSTDSASSLAARSGSSTQGH